MNKSQMKHSKETVSKLLENIREIHGSHDSYACFPVFLSFCEHPIIIPIFLCYSVSAAITVYMVS